VYFRFRNAQQGGIRQYYQVKREGEREVMNPNFIFFSFAIFLFQYFSFTTVSKYWKILESKLD